ncbi:hypothetical protein Bbelb_383220 [Branchiostoma belcheri]|nr:hypothetical protein Bbelb_383220 [Branchiostoma belcheri]
MSSTAVPQSAAITIGAVTGNSISITWTEATGDKDSYRVSIDPADSADATVTDGATLQHEFTGLTAGREYTIRVVTVSGGANSAATTATQRTTVPQSAAITIGAVTGNSISITWTEATGDKDSYRVSIDPADSADATVTDGATLQHEFTGLTAGREYTIRVVTVSGGANSAATTATQRTS